jgi:protein-tyrosine phosphatase
VRKKLIKYLATDRIQLIGSDCHNLDSRPPEYAEGVKEIIDKCGEDKLDELMKNANMLI